jgi:ABC-type transport system involved in cytochrome bd biosynthesis fused ATPase/permease subunit
LKKFFFLFFYYTANIAIILLICNKLRTFSFLFMNNTGYMSTAVIEIKNDLAYSFLHNLERMNVLRVISRQNEQTDNRQKLSERFAGALSSERVDELQEELKQMRNEWDRDIY